jgi:hypothetical protein
MLLWIRIQAVRGSGIDDAFKGSARVPVKGRVIVHAEALRHIVRPGRHNVTEFRPYPLHRLHQFGIEAKLQDGAAPGFASELRVDHLIGPGPESARPFDAA